MTTVPAAAALRTELLANGLQIQFFDRSNRYFGDYHRVCIEARCSLVLQPALVAALADASITWQQVSARLGERLEFVRTLERMGVAGAQVASVTQELLASFMASAAPYLSRPDLPLRLLRRELEQPGKGKPRPWPR